MSHMKDIKVITINTKCLKLFTGYNIAEEIFHNKDIIYYNTLIKLTIIILYVYDTINT